MTEKRINSFDEHNANFRKTHDDLLKVRVNILVEKEKKRDSDGFFDCIDEILKAKECAEIFKVSPNCKKEAFSHRTYRTCKTKLEKKNYAFETNKTHLPIYRFLPSFPE